MAQAPIPPPASMPAWLTMRWENVMTHYTSPPYQASRDLLNATLSLYFTVERRFLVDPQPYFFFQPASDASQKIGLIPAFTVVKAAAKAQDDTLVVVVEIKREDVSMETARRQLTDYLVYAAGKQRAATLNGFLVAGDVVERHYLPAAGSAAVPVQDPTDYHVTGAAFYQLLYDISMRN
ncbi:hypothetical protein B0H21DRAFT_109905 [Amylocystis lapponica]|nr:hypothetical protein B0H21DRAFT_109905 [Amylocystis lapponica]